MKNEFNKVADTYFIYRVSIDAQVSPMPQASLYHQAMQRAETFSAYVNGWAVGTGGHSRGDYMFCHADAPTKDGKPDVMTGDTPTVRITCTPAVMRRFQKEFAPQITGIRRIEKFNDTPTREQNWKHPRKDAKQSANPHYLSTPFGDRLFRKK